MQITTTNNKICFHNMTKNIRDYYLIIRDCEILEFTQDAFHPGITQRIFLTKKLTHVVFDNNYAGSSTLNKNLKLIRFGLCLTVQFELSKNLLRLYFHPNGYYNKSTKLTKNLLVVNFGYMFNKPIFLSKNLLEIEFSGDFNQRIILPKNLTKLVFDIQFNQPLVLTPRLKYITLSCEFKQSVIFEHQPKNITIYKLSIVPTDYLLIDNLPNGSRLNNSSIQFIIYRQPCDNLTQLLAFSKNLRFNLPSDMKII